MKITEDMSEPVRAQFMFGLTMLVVLIVLLVIYLHRLASGTADEIPWWGWFGIVLGFIGSSMQVLGALAMAKQSRDQEKQR